MHHTDSHKVGPYQDPNWIQPKEEPASQSADPTHTYNDNSMSVKEILDRLISRGVRDITDQIDSSSTTRFPTASGGRFEVYEARLTDGSHIAIKCPRITSWGDDMQMSLERTAHELYVWSKCAHPNLVPLIGIAQFRGQIALISPWMENGTVSQYLSHNSASVATRYRMCEMISGAVAYLHNMGIVHGDIKSSNILVSKDGTPALGGFGNAEPQGMSFRFASSESTVGFSIRCAAPELFMGESQMPTLYADVYALGMTIFEIITGVVPFSDLRDMAVMLKIMRGERPRRPDCLPIGDTGAESLWSLLQECWHPDPPARPRAAHVWEVMKELAA